MWWTPSLPVNHFLWEDEHLICLMVSFERKLLKVWPRLSRCLIKKRMAPPPLRHACKQVMFSKKNSFRLCVFLGCPGFFLCCSRILNAIWKLLLTHHAMFDVVALACCCLLNESCVLWFSCLHFQFSPSLLILSP